MADLDPRCPFCSEDIGLDRSNRERHIGRHMEGIAFAVVTKPYEEWEFYSGPSEQHLEDPSLGAAASWYSEPTWYLSPSSSDNEDAPAPRLSSVNPFRVQRRRLSSQAG